MAAFPAEMRDVHHRRRIAAVAGLPRRPRAGGGAGVAADIAEAILDGRQPVALTATALGCVVGLAVFSTVLNWALEHHHDLVMAAMVGLMLGSLNKVWPWKETLAWRTNSHGEPVPLLEQNLLPGAYGDLTGQDPQLLLAILLAGAGIALVLGLEWFAGRHQPVAQSV